MKRKVLSMLICTALILAQTSITQAETATASSTGDGSGSTLASAGDSTKSTSTSTVNEAEEAAWNSRVFGTSTSKSNNSISVDKGNKTVTINAGSVDGSKAGGKITGGQDGISYYYIEIDPSKNFEISADVKVNYFEKNKPDYQAGFGIMARDTIGPADDSSISASNMCLVGGYNGAVESVFRNGVTKDFSQQIVMEGEHKFYDRPANDGTAIYKLKLKKTNTGYIASVDDKEEVTYYRPKQLEVVDGNKIYVGFFAARVASITVSNINLKTSEAANDPKGEQEPAVITQPDIKVTSAATLGTSNYDLSLKANVDGNVNVNFGGKLISREIKKDIPLEIPVTLSSGDNIFDIKYNSNEKNAETKEISQTVTFKNYGTENSDIYVSPDGTGAGKGTIDDPIDIYSALQYTNDGQTIKVKGGMYNLSKPIVINKTNSGAQGKIKTLTSYDGQRPIFNFGKNCDGVNLSADYWKVYGIDVTNTADKKHGITIAGSNNVFENVKTYKNGDSGLQISGDSNDPIENWPSNNLVLNSESYDNLDAAMNNADGFAAKISVGTGNVFRGCVSHNNCDDGWDLYSKLEIGKIGAVTIDNCIAYENGVLSDGTKTKGDGNGFKLGGEGISVKHKLSNSLSFGNRATGITSNSNPAMIVDNCISADNDVNYSTHYYTNAVLDFDLSNDKSFQSSANAKEDDVDKSVEGSKNYFYNGTDAENADGKQLTSSMFKSTKMPKAIERDNNGRIIWPEYMTPVGSATNTSTPAVTISVKDVSPNIVVDTKYAGNDGAEVGGIPTYKTLGAAIAAIDPNNKSEKVIFMKDGVYKEKLTIGAPNITLVGENSENTIITYDDANGTKKRAADGGDGKATYGTTGSSSVTVKETAANFKAVNLTISNSFDEGANSTMSSKQAVAMKNEADHSIFVNCRFLGNQDTLYANKNKQYYYNCYIEGDVDFIFGGAQAVFKNCEIKSVSREGIEPKGYVSAPSTLQTDKYGFLIEDCNLTSNISEKGSVYLGRPWHPGGATGPVVSTVVYRHCNLGAHIAEDGWSTMSNNGVIAYPKDNFMYEYDNYGEGKNTTNKNRSQLRSDQAASYTEENVLSGWKPGNAIEKLSAYLLNK